MKNDAIIRYDEAPGSLPPCPPVPSPEIQAEKLRELLLDIVDEKLAEIIVTALTEDATDEEIPSARAVWGLKEEVDQMSEYADEAAASAAAAASSAEDAETAQSAAEDAAAAAASSATAAAGSATAAGESATDAASSATDAAEDAAAASSAKIAAQAAQAAAEAAVLEAAAAGAEQIGLIEGKAAEERATLSAYAEQAEASATAADALATAADASATEAAGSASDASASATAADESADAAAASAAAADASADAAAASAATLVLDSSLTSASQAAQAKAVGDELTNLKSAVKERTLYAITDTDVFDWQAKWRVNSTKKGYSTNTDKYAGLGKPKATSGIYPVYAYSGSTIKAKTGYTMDYSIVTEYSTGSVLESQRGVVAGTVITISHDGILLLSVTDGSTAVTTSTEAKALAKAGLEISLLCKTVKEEIENKLDKNQGSENAGKIMQVGNDGALTPVPVPTDVTLQKSGVPADAKTVGENLLLSMDAGSIVFKIGGFNAIGNTNDTMTTHVRTKSPVKVGGYGGSIGCDEGYEIRVFNYSSASFGTDNLISKSNYTSNTVELIPNTYVGFSIRNLTPVDQTDVSNSEHFIINIPEQTVAQAVKKLINGDISSYNHGPYDLYKGRFDEWYSGLQEDYTEFSRTTKYAEVITAFDALMALDTQYISKNTLGTASGTDSGGNAYTMYEYVFKPKNYLNTINTRKVPKIYIDGSIHGFEKCGTFGLYYFLKDLVTNWDKNLSLAAIRQSVEIHVIPVSNPYGFDNFIYKNGNSVNINRNFDHNGEWIVVPDGDQQNGLAAFDQPESAIIRDWILADEANILCYLPLHTNGMWNVSNYGEMNANMPSSDRYDDYYNRIFRVITNHIEEQTIRWPMMYENIRPGSSSFCGKIQASVTEASTKGTASQWANTMRRIVSMTFEGFNGININDVQIVEVFSAQAQKMNSENIGNIVIQMLMEYSD